MRVWSTILCAAIVSVGAATPGWATLFCEIKPTRDGFVALRAGPGSGARLVARMRRGDEVLLREGRNRRWVQVTFWRGGRLVEGGPPGGKPATAEGWMHSALIAPDSCG